MKQIQDTRIGIIGAGVAGLTVARALRDKGYKTITLLEKREIAAGKARTFLNFGHPYELGASLINPDDPITLSILKELNVKPLPYELDRRILNLYATEIRGLDQVQNKLKVLWELFRFTCLAIRYRKIYQPGFKQIPPDLHQSFHQFCANHKFVLLEELFSLVFSTAGYGYPDTIPAAYYFKFITPAAIYVALTRRALRYPGGAATVWRKFAEQFEIQFQQKIVRIERSETVKVQTETDIFEFDKLIIACPFDIALEFLDTSVEERSLFLQIDYIDYYVYCCLVNGLPKGTTVLPINSTQEKRGSQEYLLGIFHIFKDTNLYQCYMQVFDTHKTEEELKCFIAEVLEKMNATVEKEIAAMRWKRYFPHFNSKALQGGFYERLENLQGVKHTYYVGELMNFALVRTVAQYSYDLVDRYF